MGRYCFSGHESFQCKALWLKKGYDFLKAGNRFSDEDAVAKLGVGKNMVASIRYWLKVFGLTKGDEVTKVADFIFDSQVGVDPFAEDLNTLWLLHFLLIFSDEASLYKLLFVNFKKEKKDFSKSELQLFIKRKCSILGQKNVYNENTVRKDIGVLLKNYVAPSDLKRIEDFSSLLIGLELIISSTSDNYFFKTSKNGDLAPEIILFSLIRMKGNDQTVSFDMLQEICLIFGVTMVTLIDIIHQLETMFPATIIFSDNSGIKNVQFLWNIDELDALKHYYESL